MEVLQWGHQLTMRLPRRAPQSEALFVAAIHAMGNGKYTLKAVRRSKNGWGNAGVNDTTAPF